MNRLRPFVVAAALLGTSQAARAERWVVVNGVRLSDPDIVSLERVHCGPIPNGRYWLDVRTGTWGYAANPVPQGNIVDNCVNPGPRPGLSQRGQLYTPYDWVR